MEGGKKREKRRGAVPSGREKGLSKKAQYSLPPNRLKKRKKCRGFSCSGKKKRTNRRGQFKGAHTGKEHAPALQAGRKHDGCCFFAEKRGEGGGSLGAGREGRRWWPRRTKDIKKKKGVEGKRRKEGGNGETPLLSLRENILLNREQDSEAGQKKKRSRLPAWQEGTPTAEEKKREREGK